MFLQGKDSYRMQIVPQGMLWACRKEWVWPGRTEHLDSKHP